AAGRGAQATVRRARRAAAHGVPLPAAVRVPLPRHPLRLRVDRGVARGADRRGRRRAVSEALLLDPEACDLCPASAAAPEGRAARAGPGPEAGAEARAPAPCPESGRLSPEDGADVAQRRLLLLADQRATEAEEAALLGCARHPLRDLLQPLRERRR